jgi:alkylated DNA repair protein alkB family protein 1
MVSWSSRCQLNGTVCEYSFPCRGYLKGVPRILEGTLPSHLGPLAGSRSESAADRTPRTDSSASGASDHTFVKRPITAEDWSPFAAYMATTRINVNVRQVFPKGFVPPESVASTPEGRDVSSVK